MNGRGCKRDGDFDTVIVRKKLKLVDPATVEGDVTISGDVTGATFNDVIINDGAASAVVIGSETDGNNDTNSIAIGPGAGAVNQQVNAIAIGWQAGADTQYPSGLAIGNSAGNTGQQQSAIAIGTDAGKTNQNTNGVAIGKCAGLTSQGNDTIAIGADAGRTSQSSFAVAVGHDAGRTSQGFDAVAIGNASGLTSQGEDGIAIGNGAAIDTQSSQAVAIGRNAGYSKQGQYAIAVGDLAQKGGNATPVTNIGTVTITSNAQVGFPAFTDDGKVDLDGLGGGFVTAAVGEYLVVNVTDGGGQATLITPVDGIERLNDGDYVIAAGDPARLWGVGGAARNYSISIGSSTGRDSQGLQAVAIGQNAGQCQSGQGSIAIGPGAGQVLLGKDSIAIGSLTSSVDFSESIALGKDAACTKANQMMIGSVTEVVPDTANTCDLGSATLPLKDVHLSGDVVVDGSAALFFSSPVDDTNMVAGTGAGGALTTGAGTNTLIGKEIGAALTTQDSNTFMGSNSALALDACNNMTVIGANTLEDAKDSAGDNGSWSVVVGANVAQTRSSVGKFNTLIGAQVGQSGTGAFGENNSVVGYSAGKYMLNSDNNSLFGHQAGARIQTASSHNVCIGYDSVTATLTGGHNTAIGADTAALAAGDYQIALGAEATCGASEECCIGGATTGQSVTVIRPGKNSYTSLGNSSYNFTDLYLSGAVIDNIPAAIDDLDSPYTMADSEHIVRCDTTSNLITITLPDCATNNGKRYMVALETDGGNDVTINRAGSDTINGLTTGFALADAGSAWSFYAMGTNWYATATN